MMCLVVYNVLHKHISTSEGNFFLWTWSLSSVFLTKELERSLAHFSNFKSYYFLKWTAAVSVLAGGFSCLTVETNGYTHIPFVYSYLSGSTFLLTASVSFHFKPYCKNWRLIHKPSQLNACAKLCLHVWFSMHLGKSLRLQLSRTAESIKRREQNVSFVKRCCALKK